MDSDVVIKVEGLSKKFCRSLKRSLFYGSLDIARNMLGIPYDKNRLRLAEFMALDNVSFELRKGEALGIVGQNGSGKTTLLRLINGIFPPDNGKITVRGRIGALIAVGAGFHPNMTGRQNIYLNGTILGMSRKEIDEKIGEIIAFADIGQFIDSPVSTYSSGMTVRLGFAIAIHSSPDILLIDEILAVGDMNFQNKCMSKIADVMAHGASIIFISHQMLNIQKICTKGLLMEHGKVVKYGDVSQIIDEYYKQNSSGSILKEEEKKKEIVGSTGITCKSFKIFDSKGKETRGFGIGDDIVAEWSFNITEPLEDVVVHFSMADGPYTYNGYVSSYDGLKIKRLDDKTIIRLIIRNVRLAPGNYSVSIGLWDKNFIGSYFWDYESTGIITINANKRLQGRFEFEHQWEIGVAE
ncbi:ABC transporter ATP-binding protein [Candidatus Uhrbacteria bacterium]|nr:ABC transporter ATP-binding protein [Candidatus Uhrbacteria bacterium]